MRVHRRQHTLRHAMHERLHHSVAPEMCAEGGAHTGGRVRPHRRQWALSLSVQMGSHRRHNCATQDSVCAKTEAHCLHDPPCCEWVLLSRKIDNRFDLISYNTHSEYKLVYCNHFNQMCMCMRAPAKNNQRRCYLVRFRTLFFPFGPSRCLFRSIFRTHTLSYCYICSVELLRIQCDKCIVIVVHDNLNDNRTKHSCREVALRIYPRSVGRKKTNELFALLSSIHGA